MKKHRIFMILLFLAGILIVGACEKFDDPPVKLHEPIETLEEKSLENPEDADESKKEKPALPANNCYGELTTFSIGVNHPQMC